MGCFVCWLGQYSYAGNVEQGSLDVFSREEKPLDQSTPAIDMERHKYVRQCGKVLAAGVNDRLHSGENIY